MTDSSLSSASRPTNGASLPLQSKHESAGFTPNWGSRQVLAQLHASFAVGGVHPDAMLQRIVNAAQLFTDANGAAIALHQGSWIVCRARAGEMAPELNSKLDSGSGISGECLRSGKPLCCHDAWADSRVDADACRRLGLRSLAAAPIGGTPNVQGILEVFSAQPDAFGDIEVNFLNELAGLITAVHQARKTAVGRIGERFARQALALPKSRLVAAGVLALAFLLSVTVRKRPEDSNLAARAGAQPLNVQASPTAIDFSHPVLKPEPLSITNDMKPKPSAGIVMASRVTKFGASGAIIAPPLSEAAPGVDHPVLTVPGTRSHPAQLPDESTPIPPAVAILSGTSNKAIAGLLSPSIVIPQEPVVRLSQGLSGGMLENKVNPIYPNDALLQRRQGRVTLDGVIAEDGRLHDLKVVSGDPLLARAAMQAVSQWRYQPYALNGERIRRATTITLIFKLP